MPQVLNPGLYRALQRIFGRVKIQQEGEAFDARPVHDIVTGEPRLEIAHAGEYYRVCCFACSDTRFRLYINHMWGQLDQHGRPMTFLAVCYNETACMSNPERREALIEMISEMPSFLREQRVHKGKHVPAHDRAAVPPGPCTRLDALPITHKACAYLDSRGFDPVDLARRYGVSYCLDSHYTYARDRIIIPVIEYGKLCGWQARYIGELPWKDKRQQGLPPKYFTMPGMKRARLIYNWDNMRRHQTGVIEEGAIDVWGLGLMGGGIFGNVMSHDQTRKFLACFRKRSGVLLLDPEEMDSESTQRKLQELRRVMPYNLAAVTLPEGTDPGSLDQEFLRDYIYHEALAQGVNVSWELAPETITH